MEKHSATEGAHDLQNNSQSTCSCSKTTSFDQKSSSPPSGNATARQPHNTSLGASSVIESASATTSRKNHTDSAPLVIFAISIVILLFIHPALTNFTRNSIAHLQRWAGLSHATERNHPRRHWYSPYQDGETMPEKFFFIIPNLFQDNSDE